MIKIALTGGGTGGHIYPGIAVADKLKELSDAELFWIGSKTGMDRTIVESAGIPFYGIAAGKLRRYFSLKNITDLFMIIAGFFRSRSILKKEKPSLLFSKGGFVSVPPVVAAFSLGIPVFTHESDFSPGLATRINSRFADSIFTAYEDTRAMFAPRYRGKVRLSGNPVRREFRAARDEAAASRERGRDFLGIKAARPLLLVLGGSQGAREINELVKRDLSRLTEYFTVVHQTGHSWEAPAENEFYKPRAYIAKEMPDVLAAADIVLGRSGAGTVWECAVMGKPMILIPLKGSGTRGDQVENAEYCRKAGAALVLTDGDEKIFGASIIKIASDGPALKAMAASSSAMGKVDAAAVIADTLIELVRQPASLS